MTEDLMKKLEEMSQQGDELVDQEQYEEAIALYSQGLDMMPDSEEYFGTRFWFLTAIGDVLWYLGSYEEALSVWDQVFIYGDLANPFIHLRRGQVLFELGEKDEALDELHKAMLLHGKAIFEDEDEKYLDQVMQNTKPPAGCSDWNAWPGIDSESDKDKELLAGVTDPEQYRRLLEQYPDV